MGKTLFERLLDGDEEGADSLREESPEYELEQAEYVADDTPTKTAKEILCVYERIHKKGDNVVETYLEIMNAGDEVREPDFFAPNQEDPKGLDKIMNYIKSTVRNTKHDSLGHPFEVKLYFSMPEGDEKDRDDLDLERGVKVDYQNVGDEIKQDITKRVREEGIEVKVYK